MFFKKSKLRKSIIFIFILGISISNVGAKTIEVMECEYTNLYKEWLKLSDSEKAKVDEPIKCKMNEVFFSSVESSVKETYQSSKFDLRDYSYVTSVKNQSNTGLCWAFSSLASIESNLLMQNLGTYDFSEAHMGFSAQNKSFSGLMPVNREYDSGANWFIASAYLLNRMGPVLETDMPFSLVTTSSATTPSKSLSSISIFSVPSSSSSALAKSVLAIFLKL